MTAQTCADPEGGQGVRTPSGKSQVICVFMEISIWTPPPWKCWTPPPLKNVGPPMYNRKISLGFKKTLLRLFFGSRAPRPHPSPPLTKIPGYAHRKEIVIASPRHLNYVHENVVITSNIFRQLYFPVMVLQFLFLSHRHTISSYRLTFCKLIELIGGS